MFAPYEIRISESKKKKRLQVVSAIRYRTTYTILTGLLEDVHSTYVVDLECSTTAALET